LVTHDIAGAVERSQSHALRACNLVVLGACDRFLFHINAAKKTGSENGLNMPQNRYVIKSYETLNVFDAR